jgi:peptidyl-tRNA hydrolase, PTH1 family
MAHALRLIVGLGNPGREYAPTRHNAGAWFVERLAATLRVEFRAEAKFQALVAHARIVGADLRLVLPQTFMNRSGTTVAAMARFYRIAVSEMLVAHDELDLKPGTVKFKLDGGNAGHNGLKDITAELGTAAFWRLRIGIGHPRDGALSQQEVADYVLQPPRGADQASIDDAVTRALAVWPRLAVGETERAMHELHTTAANATPPESSGKDQRKTGPE